MHACMNMVVAGVGKEMLDDGHHTTHEDGRAASEP